MKRIYELNERFFELYSRLNEYSSDMTKRQQDAMSSRLLKQYEVEFSKIAEIKSMEDKREIFSIKTEKGYYTPKVFLFFKNKLAKLMIKEIRDSASEYYKKYFDKKIEVMTGGAQTKKKKAKRGEIQEIPLSELHKR